jgi:hypothetical protein
MIDLSARFGPQERRAAPGMFFFLGLSLSLSACSLLPQPAPAPAAPAPAPVAAPAPTPTPAPAPMVAPAPAPAPIPVLPLDTALLDAASKLFSAASSSLGTPQVHRLLVIDPLVDAVSYTQSVTTQSMEAKIQDLAVRRELIAYHRQPRRIGGFEYLQMLRLRQQDFSGGDGSNRVDPYALNEVDQRMLKEAFRQARKLQQRLKETYQW